MERLLGNMADENVRSPAQTEEALREAIAQYERQVRLFDGVASTTPDFVYVFDTGGRFLYANRRLLEVWGLQKEEALGKTCLELGYEQWHHDKHMREIAQVIATKRSIKGEVPFKAPRTGIYGVYEYIFTPVIGPDGEVEAISGTTREVSERKLAEQRQELLSHTVSRLLTAPDPQAVVETLCEDVRRFLQCDVFFNFLKDETTGRLKLNACGGVDPEIARRVEALPLDASLCGSSAKGACRVYAQCIDHASDPRANQVRSMGIRAYACHPLLGAKQEAIGTLSFGARDRQSFTAEELELMKTVADHVAVAMLRRNGEEALRESEERFRIMADGLPLIVWVHDTQGNQQFVNQTFCEFFGVSAEEMTGENWRELTHPEDRDQYLDGFAKCLREQRPFHGQTRVRNATGEWRWLESFARPRCSPSGEFLGMVGASLDVTDRKRAEELLARSNEELEQLVAQRTVRLQELVEELEHFSYTITHDMRAPLRAMRGIAEILNEEEDQWKPEDRKKLIRRIITAAERMDMLITDALQYSKMVKQELPAVTVDVGCLLQGMLDTYPELQTANAEISLQPDIPPVIGNEAGLTQCFSNLLSNAVKFAKSGEKARVRIWAETAHLSGARAQPESWVRIWIEDNGIGISEAMKSRVFGLFARGSSPQAGTGIGLALVRKVVDRMGGHVGVETQEGQGSRFWVEFRAGEPRVRNVPV